MKAPFVPASPQSPNLRHTFRCHTDDCCPQLLVDALAPEVKKYIIRDDWGQQINLSESQLLTILATTPADIGL